MQCNDPALKYGATGLKWDETIRHLLHYKVRNAVIRYISVGLIKVFVMV